MRRHGGLTLIELLIAVSLSIVIVGIVASTSIQSQNAMNYAEVRQAASAHARGLFADIERDLGSMICVVPVAAPFDKDNGGNDNKSPIQIGATQIQTPTPPDANCAVGAGFKRYADRLRIVTVNDDGDRMMVEYCLDGPAAKKTTFTDANSGGFWTSNLRRHTLVSVKGGLDPTVSSNVVKETDPKAAPILLERVVSFELDYVLSGESMIHDTADPANATQADDGTLFALEADCNVDANDDTKVNPNAAADKALFQKTPVGQPISLFVRGPTAVATLFAIRRKDSGGASGAWVSDRVSIDPSVTPPIKGRAVVPPSIVVATVVIAIGKGPGGDTAQFTRQIPVSR